MTAPVAPLLVFGWGNLSRGDDALGPLCVERLRALPAADARVDYLDDYQLQVEHALDLVGRERVLFVDASRSCRAPFELTQLHAAPDISFTTHALTPQALLQVFCDLRGEAPPPCTLLAIRGESFDLGAPLGAAAQAHLAAALAWATDWLAAPVAEPNTVDLPFGLSCPGTQALLFDLDCVQGGGGDDPGGAGAVDQAPNG